MPDLFDLPPETVAAVANPLLARGPELVAELAAFQAVAAGYLLDALIHRDGRLNRPEPANSIEDAKAVAVVLRILTRPEWTERHLDEFRAYWRTAWQSELFGYEFEAVRHRIQHAVAEAEDILSARGPDV